jgi:aerobic carbon-monoxide dehydrogenase small subunit
MRREITFTLNGEEKSVFVEPNLTLLQVLREQLTVTSPKRSCEQGECGACTVILNGKAVNACLVLAVTVQGKRVETVESLMSGTELHPLQRAFVDITAAQCGYCTPGMLLAAKALLDANPDPSYEEVKVGLAGNLCRCTGYVKPVEAVLTAAAELRAAGVKG